MAAKEGRSLVETPTWSVATSPMPASLIERSLSRFAMVPKVSAELMLLGGISLFLSLTLRFIYEICVPSSLFTSRFYMCSDSDYKELMQDASANQMALEKTLFGSHSMHVCSYVPARCFVR
ncbi:hypothetical protein PVAP13_9KG281326 [Panicum virgatum]|uniref:Uncharacterized protein n=1 Tax=Panicum virgatum TaxID=38727 RepID=A0A8T0NJ75_PANVG|nr:hypothetical protein PVAP13_9KG281326 [Panicum virgatum]